MAYLSSLQQGIQDVASAGTAEALSSDVALHVNTLIIQARRDNTGNIYIGAAAVDDVTGISLAAGETLSLTPESVHNGATADIAPSEVYVDADVSTDGVTFLYTEQSRNL